MRRARTTTPASLSGTVSEIGGYCARPQSCIATPAGLSGMVKEIGGYVVAPSPIAYNLIHLPGELAGAWFLLLCRW